VKRYALLFVIALLLGMVIAPLARRHARPDRRVAIASAVPTATVSLAITEHGLVPDALAVPKGHRVVLTIVNQSAREHTVSLAGYEDRLAIGSLAPGASVKRELLADRPGDDFAWLLDGQPAGRMSVQGSHLVEGHR
jgi:hypothetical protein